MINFTPKQKEELRGQFVSGYEPTNEDLIHMFNKLKLKGRINENWYRLEVID